jgi:hypothetical protein
MRFESNLTDDSQYGHRATASGVSYAAGQEGSALSVGTQSTVRVAGSAALDTEVATVELWAQARELSGRRMTLVEGSWRLVILGSGSFMCSTSGGYALVGEVFRPGVWTSVACTFDGSQVVAWVNGVRRAQAMSAPLRPVGEAGLTVGWSASSESTEKFDGLIDNLRFWRSVRAERQICEGAISCR